MSKDLKCLIKLQKELNTELKCVKYLIKLRWDNKPICVHCGSDRKIWHLSELGRFKCGSCNKKFSVRLGTIFEDSKLPLTKWFIAFHLEINHKKGISSPQLATDLGVQQRTAWFMQQRIRYALAYNTIEKMSGNIEIDETYIGGKEKNKHDSKKNIGSHGGKFKLTVVGMLQRKGRTILQYVNKKNIKHIKPILDAHIDYINSNLHTDESTLYQAYNRNIVTHSKGEYVNGNIYTNSIEGVFSLFKRRVYGIHHQISAKHLQKYINSFIFRYNNRRVSDFARLGLALQSMFGKRLQYKELVG